MDIRSPIPISVCIVAKNEERNLSRLLESVSGWVAEVVVVLNDTSDGSEDIARRFGAKVFHQNWLGFRDSKNAALDLCEFNWVLSLDADEEVSFQLKQEIISFFLSKHDNRYSGARFPRKVWLIDRWITHGDWYPDLSLRLFRRDSARWDGDAHAHEKLRTNGEIITLRGDLNHYTMPSLYGYIVKIPYFAELDLKRQLERGKKFSIVSTLFRAFWRFFRAYVLRRGFLDGYPGFIIAAFTAFSTFVRYTRLYEHVSVSAVNPETDR